ncbi:hypothetical protein [Pedobacter psychroterrae]|uniref:Uncharacterized protein n=1 Tax=Pedobacter psychroterrae TaxID=2530453 RepID=A0A4R0NV46_9SPHI|nr:hypothetical protein [Pedobacter psychroterrae]TCD03405.1 hypothetical protein EZ437_05390 [Pedobacter psychroterrae]
MSFICVLVSCGWATDEERASYGSQSGFSERGPNLSRSWPEGQPKLKGYQSERRSVADTLLIDVFIFVFQRTSK